MESPFKIKLVEVLAEDSNQDLARTSLSKSPGRKNLHVDEENKFLSQSELINNHRQSSLDGNIKRVRNTKSHRSHSQLNQI